MAITPPLAVAYIILAHALFVISLSVLKEVLIAVVIEPGQSMYHLILATHEMLTNPSGFCCLWTTHDIVEITVVMGEKEMTI